MLHEEAGLKSSTVLDVKMLSIVFAVHQKSPSPQRPQLPLSHTPRAIFKDPQY